VAAVGVGMAVLAGSGGVEVGFVVATGWAGVDGGEAHAATSASSNIEQAQGLR